MSGPSQWWIKFMYSKKDSKTFVLLKWVNVVFEMKNGSD